MNSSKKHNLGGFYYVDNKRIYIQGEHHTFVPFDRVDYESFEVLNQTNYFKDKECGFLIYRTFAGLRLIATHKSFDPSSEESQKIFDVLGTDPLYQKLCKAQNSFRARLSPKFWRMKKELVEKLRLAPRLKYRITKNMIPTWSKNDAERLEEYDTWVKNYEQMHEVHATCKFLKHIGNKQIFDTFKPLIKYHDRSTQANSNLPLA